MVKLTILEHHIKIMLEDNVLCFFGGYITEHAKKSKYGYDGKEVDEESLGRFYYFECSEDFAKVMYNAIIGSYVAGRIYEFTKKLSWKLNNKKEVEDNGRGDC